MLLKRISLLLFLGLTLYSQVTPPFSRGVNLSNWFQENSAQEIQFTKYTFEDFEDIQSLGVDVIRLPINLHGMSSGSPDYTIDPLLFFFLDEIISWTEALDLHLILDNHSFSPTGQTEPGVYSILVAIWPQIAERYLDSEAKLYYEVLNEPTGISDLVWNTIQPNVVAAIRAVDSERTVVVGPASWNSYNNLDDMPVYTDDNLIYTFHFYDPFIFTHQGASWTDPSMVSLSGIPFPYGASAMPAVPPDLIGTWIHSSMGGYATEGTVASMREKLDIAIAFSEARGVPIYCGEFGAYQANADPLHRINWYDETVHYLDSMHVAWTMWDYHGGFGLYASNGYGMFDHDLNIPLVEAMGFNVPEQTNFEIHADTSGFDIYQDYIMPGINDDHHNDGDLNLYANENPKYGAHCLAWSDAAQYNSLGFRFDFPRDMSYLLNQNYILTLWIRPGGTPNPLDLRFVDSKNAIPEDRPWRMSYSIESSQLVWNDQWQYLQIPLGAMTETGSYDNGSYHAPEGLFDWGAIQSLELVAEQQALTGTSFYFDAIRIVDPMTASLKTKLQPGSAQLLQNYPNPFNAGTQIPFTLDQAGIIKLNIFDIRGRQLRSLLTGYQDTGTYSIQWDGRDQAGQQLSTGVYLVQLDLGGHSELMKVSLLK